MHKTLIGLFGLFLVACTSSQTTAPLSAQQAFEQYVSALNQGDIALAAAYYDTKDGFHWIERGHVQYESGADAAKALLALQNSGGKSKMVLDTIRVAELSDTSALLSTHFDFSKLADDGSPQFSFDGWMTVGMVKRSDGWKIAGGQTGPGKTE